ncbi:MAG: hypothetical protein ACREMY_21255 [bacterium]
MATLDECAAKGLRCPITGYEDITTPNMTALARAGKIETHISAHNWRQVFILEGPMKGKCTAPNPMKKAATYKIIGRETVERRAVDRRVNKPPVTLPDMKFLRS